MHLQCIMNRKEISLNTKWNRKSSKALKYKQKTGVVPLEYRPLWLQCFREPATLTKLQDILQWEWKGITFFENVPSRLTESLFIHFFLLPHLLCASHVFNILCWHNHPSPPLYLFSSYFEQCFIYIVPWGKCLCVSKRSDICALLKYSKTITISSSAFPLRQFLCSLSSCR